jgi:hypothetical protein
LGASQTSAMVHGCERRSALLIVTTMMNFSHSPACAVTEGCASAVVSGRNGGIDPNLCREFAHSE